MFQNKKTDGISTGVVIWQSKNTQVAQGGFTLDDSAFPEGSEIPSGTVIAYDESTRLAKVSKSAVMQASATNTAVDYKVLKGHVLRVGMTIKTGAGTAQAITAIDKTDAAFDKVTVGTTIGAAAAVGAEVFVDDAGYSGTKGLLYSGVIIGNNGIADVTVVIRGTVYARRIPPVSAAVQAKMPNIIFSQSF